MKKKEDVKKEMNYEFDKVEVSFRDGYRWKKVSVPKSYWEEWKQLYKKYQKKIGVRAAVAFVATFLIWREELIKIIKKEEEFTDGQNRALVGLTICTQAVFSSLFVYVGNMFRYRRHVDKEIKKMLERQLSDSARY